MAIFKPNELPREIHHSFYKTVEKMTVLVEAAATRTVNIVTKMHLLEPTPDKH